jgi:hypothetical protein
VGAISLLAAPRTRQARRALPAAFGAASCGSRRARVGPCRSWLSPLYRRQARCCSREPIARLPGRCPPQRLCAAQLALGECHRDGPPRRMGCRLFAFFLATGPVAGRCPCSPPVIDRFATDATVGCRARRARPPVFAMAASVLILIAFWFRSQLISRALRVDVSRRRMR